MMPTGKGIDRQGRLAGCLCPVARSERFPFPGNGLQFEAAAVMEAVRRGATGAEIMPLADSVEVLRIIAAVLAGKPQQIL